MEVRVTVVLDLPVEADPSRLPAIVSLNREQSLAVLDLLLGDRQDGIAPSPV